MCSSAPAATARCPSRVKDDLGEADGSRSYEVDFASYCDVGRRRSGLYGMRPYESGLGFSNDEYSEYRDGQRIHLDAKDGTDLRSSRGDLWVPKGYKLLTVEESKSDTQAKKYDKGGPASCSPCAMGDSSQSKTSPIQPGNLADAELAIHDQDRRAAADPRRHRGVHQQQPADQPARRAGAPGARITASARTSPGTCSSRPRPSGRSGYRVKYADPYLTYSGPSAPYFPEPPYDAYNPMGANVPTRTSRSKSCRFRSCRPHAPIAASTIRGPARRRPSTISNPFRASQSGQKEVFDTAMIGSMLKAVRDDTMVDRYLPDMIKGMDRKARVLFQLYANGDKFAERYGKQDLPELEDGLRNAFESTATSIIFLKQKTVQPFPEQADAVDHDPDQNA
jgi:hypothetical protein